VTSISKLILPVNKIISTDIKNTNADLAAAFYSDVQAMNKVFLFCLFI